MVEELELLDKLDHVDSPLIILSTFFVGLDDAYLKQIFELELGSMSSFLGSISIFSLRRGRSVSPARDKHVRIERGQRRLNRYGATECLFRKTSRDSIFSLVCIKQALKCIEITSYIT